MIFVTLGTSKYPFPRLVRAVDEISAEIDEEVMVQAGSTLSEFQPRNAEFTDYLSRDEYEEYVENCRLFITHGGTGSLITALRHRTPVVIFPRHADRGEHADDMMVEIADGWSERTNIAVAQSPDDLRRLMVETDVAAPTYDSPPQTLRSAVRATLPDRDGRPVIFCPTPPGGHLTQLLELTDEISGYDFRFLTWQPEITGSIDGVELVTGYHTESLPSFTTIRNMLATTLQAIRLIARDRPAAVLSLGGGAFVISVAVLAKLQGASVIHVESLTRFENASTTGRLLYPITDRFFVQHPDVLESYGEKAEFSGRVF